MEKMIVKIDDLEIITVEVSREDFDNIAETQ